MRAILLLAALHAGQAEAAAIASGRNWRIAIGGVACQDSLLVIDARIDFRGVTGAVEAPVMRLIDAEGRATVPKSLAWKSGAKPLAEWLSGGGLRNIKRGTLGELQVKFPLPVAAHGLKLEFGDVPALAITRQDGSGICESLLKPRELRAPHGPGAAAAAENADFPVHRSRYPCRGPRGVRTVGAEFPPYLPRQLLLFGRGFLPNAREIELPMGKAPAQSYSYAGPDDPRAVEDAARKIMVSDFASYPRRKYFGFNWGSQQSASGNEMYSIGIYELRPCP